MANYQLSLTGEEINERLEAIGTKDDAAAADGSLFARTTELQITSTQYSGRIQTAEETIEKNGDRLTAAEKNISTNADNITSNSARIVSALNKTSDLDTRMTAAEKKVTTNASNITSQGERLTTLEDKVPTMWVNILATKDTAVMADGVRVEIPAYTNTVIKDCQNILGKLDDVPDPDCIKRLDIHYNGIAKIKSWRWGQDVWTIDGVKIMRGLSSVTDFDVSGWDTSEMTSLFCAFINMSKVTKLDVSGFDTSKVGTAGEPYDMLGIFMNCSSLTSLDVSDWDTSHATQMNSLFMNCSSLTSLDLSNWDTTSVTSWGYMFYICSSLTDITFGEGFGKAQASGLTLDLSTCGRSKSYVLTDNTYNSMLTMYDRATNGLPTMTIKFNAKHNLPDGFVAAMTARGYTITQ